MASADRTDPVTTGPLSRSFAWTVVRIRYLVVLAWIVGAVAATFYLPSLDEAGNAPLNGLVSSDAEALAVQERSVRHFGVPLTTDVAIVQRDPGGLSRAAQQRVLARAARIDRRRPTRPGQIAYALPLVNAAGRVPASRERSTTAITYLYFTAGTSFAERQSLAREFESQLGPDDHLVGATGAALGRQEEFDQIEHALPIVEGATLGLIALVLALTFRSLGAPLVTLFAAAIAYLVTVRVVAWVGLELGVSVPREVEPLIVVLVLGIITDYSIFFLSGMRARLAAGDRRLVAAERTTATYLPTVVTAGLIVAAGTAALVVGRLDFFHAFGPGMALTALVTLAAAVTLVPALLALFGAAIFWPGGRAEPVRAQPGRARRPSLRYRIAHVATARPLAGVIAVLAVAVLVAAATGLRETRLGFTFISGLPGDVPARRAADAASKGFAPGVLAPTEVLLERRGIGGQRPALARLEALLKRQPGVAAVLGPPEESSSTLARGTAVSRTGNAARYAVIFDHDPRGGIAIDDLRGLRENLPSLLHRAGLNGVRSGFAGETALADETVSSTVDDLRRIALAALGVNLLLLVIFLRSIVAPLFLLAASVLALGATLGLTTYLFQSLLGHDQLTYYVPFAAAVLLVSLGSDYNVFVVGRVWDEAQRRPLREAIATALPRASRTITVAGVALAGSFALLATVQVRAFRELAFALAVGVLVDAFVVRSVLVPALISLFGDASWWPGRRRLRRPVRPDPVHR